MSEESDKEIPEESIVTKPHLQEAAYYKWIYRGCPSDDSITDWVEPVKN
jgi:Protein of unknown function (DUF2934)